MSDSVDRKIEACKKTVYSIKRKILSGMIKLIFDIYKKRKKNLNASALLVWFKVEMTFDSKLAGFLMIFVNNNKNLIMTTSQTLPKH